MSYYTSIVVQSSDTLSEREWNFWLRDDLVHPTFVLDRVSDRARTSKRHKMKVVAQWSRLMRRESTMERPEPPDEIKLRVRQKLNDQLEFA